MIPLVSETKASTGLCYLSPFMKRLVIWTKSLLYETEDQNSTASLIMGFSWQMNCSVRQREGHRVPVAAVGEQLG
jgi:hypothetical protein